MNKANILIADDEPGNRMALSETLADLKQNIIAVESGEAALRAVLKNQFAVILLDIRMPGLDGFETAKLIRERKLSQQTPILFLTGVYEDVASMFRGYALGAVDYLLKPIVPEILRSKISVFVDLYNKTQELNAQAEALSALSAHLETVREDEKMRLARELHDEIGSLLTAVKLDLAWAHEQMKKQPEIAHYKIGDCIRLVNTAVQSQRRIINDLRPSILDDFGIGAAIQWQAREFSSRNKIRCDVILYDDEARLDPAQSVAVYRVLQEALTNISRHSKATEVHLSLSRDDEVVAMEIRDNGVGITAEDQIKAGSHGIQGMMERVRQLGGSITIAGERGKGTAIEIQLPVARDAAAA
ncbi:MAG: ATP-binding response regulator [Burkholderiales bacterium]